MALLTYAARTVSPIQAYPAGQQEALLVRNTEPVNHVYLSNLNSGVGFDLGPGSSMIWAAGNPLYISVLDPTLPATVTILDNGGDLFDASAIAAQISISGAPPVDAPEVFLNGDSNTLNATVLDVSKFQTLMITVRGDSGNVATDTIGVEVTQSIDSTFSTVVRNDVITTWAQNSSLIMTVPIVGLYAQVNGLKNGTNPPPVGDVTYTVIGTYRQQPFKCRTYPGSAQGTSSLVTYSTGSGVSGASIWKWDTLNASQTRIEYPSVISGPVALSCRLNANVTAGTLSVFVADEAGLPLASLKWFPAGVQGDEILYFNAPTTPLRVYVVTTATFAPTSNVLFVSLSGLP